MGQETKVRPQMSEKPTQMTFLSHCSACLLEFKKKGVRVHGGAAPVQVRGWCGWHTKKIALGPGKARP